MFETAGSSHDRGTEIWFRRKGNARSARFRLICFPCGGASASSYNQWAGDLPHDIELFVLGLPGRSERFLESPITDIGLLNTEVGAAVRSLMNRPTIFFGHSLGALLSFEVIRQLRRQGDPLPTRLFVAGRAAPQLPNRDAPIHELPDEEFIAELGALGGIPDEVLATNGLIELLLPAMRADIFLNETYVHASEAQLECPITALGGNADTKVPTEDLQAWKAQTGSQFALHLFDGNHFFIHPHRRAIIRMIAEAFVRLGA